VWHWPGILLLWDCSNYHTPLQAVVISDEAANRIKYFFNFIFIKAFSFLEINIQVKSSLLEAGKGSTSMRWKNRFRN
jgi:hypothetical protein